MGFLVLILGFLGLFVGSFLNVVVHRIRTAEGGIVMGSSHCPQCRHSLAWYENMPLFGFLFVRGKCRYCSVSIAKRYVLMELGTGLVFVLISSVFFGRFTLIDLSVLSWSLLGLSLIVASSLIIIFLYDLLYMEVPMVAAWSGIIAGIGIVICEALFIEDMTYFVMHLLAAAIGAGIFYGISVYSREVWMGYGDAYIVFVMGLLLGPIGLLLGISIAAFIGAIVGFMMIVFRGDSRDAHIPFGPYLTMATLVMYVVIHVFPQFMTYFSYAVV